MIEFQIELTDKPGQLAGVTEAIASGGANILGAAAIGKARPAVALVVDDEEATKKSLDEFGANYVMNELLLYTLEHRPGALAEFTRKIADAGINLNSFYIMHMEESTAEIAFTVDKIDLVCEMFNISY
ncbi:MAG: ACT domain-containing protein [Candidatus Thermoplasmatota archaeon]|nr:ACT domain-containing protein [Candidatus Thermoplasmatota archaeon]MEE3134800.1 ACT domain-containing protein [Candidatus Thermoplasmatota archaeon]|tara:strand:- start:2652 stop:3035 length:384 start_codon:yes stop_codon:yes gene_type:complete